MYLRVIRKYLEVGKVQLLQGFQYRMNTFFLVSIIIVPPVAYFFLWKSIYSQKEIISHYKLGEIITYYIISYLFLEIKPHAWWEIADSIKDGRFSLYITKPINHLIFQMVMAYAHVVLWWIVAISGALFLFLIFKNYVILPRGITPFFLSFLFAFFGGIMGYIIEYIFNILAFWIEKPYGLLRFYNYIIYFFAGNLIPLDLLPFKKFFLSLPFKYISYYPASIFIGKVQNINIFSELMTLFFWIILFFLISQIIFYFGRKDYSAPGSL